MAAAAVTPAWVAEALAVAAAQTPAPVAWLERLRLAARSQVGQVPWPNRRQEAWRYTSLTALEVAEMQHGGAPSPAATEAARAVWAQTPALGHGPRLLFVDGHHVASAGAVPAGVTTASLATILAAPSAPWHAHLGSLGLQEDQPLAALNLALLQDAAVVHVDAGVCVDETIELTFITQATAPPRLTQPRLLVVAEADSRLQVVARHLDLGVGASFTNLVAELILGNRAELVFWRLQEGSEAATHTATVAAQVQAQAHLRTGLLALGGSLVRQSTQVALLGADAQCDWAGLQLGRGTAHLDMQVQLRHVGLRTRSSQLFKQLLHDRSSGTFGGQVLVAPGADGACAEQLSRSLLLDPGASAQTQPQLEILTDDVRCSHGATVGNLDPAALFYLQSRGLDRSAATALLTFAFAQEVLDRLQEPLARSLFSTTVGRWLGMSTDAVLPGRRS